MELAAEIHASKYRAVMAITGGGSGAIETLLSKPGASATLLEAVVPYASAALTDWLGSKAEQSCSATTARQMAMAAFHRARRLSVGTPIATESLIGIGCTASLVSNRPKKGEHRLHVAAQTASRTLCLSLSLEKGKRSRQEEEQIAARAVLAVLGDAAEVRTIDLDQTPPGIEVCLNEKTAPSEWIELLLGERELVALGDTPNELDEAVLLPGSFNPLHSGHEEIARIAKEITGRQVVFELAIRNADKPPLDYLEIEERLDSLGERQFVLTNTPTFAEKARLAPGCLFAVGADTMLRVAAERFYPDGESGLDHAIDEIASHGCRFLVFGRTVKGAFQTLDDLTLPKQIRMLCDEVPESKFHVDLSSTELRQVRDNQLK